MRLKPLPAVLPFIGLTLAFLCSPTAAQQAHEVAVAALSLPADSDGLLHWRTGERASEELQLSTRYFSDPFKFNGTQLRFYDSPVPDGPDLENGPKPLYSLTIPADKRRIYLVLWANDGDEENQTTRWQGRIFSEADWQANSMKVFNVSTETIGIAAGSKQMRLEPGRSLDFRAAEWREPFPVRILSLKPEQRMLFSSTWRVAQGRRELCFIGMFDGAVSVRALMDLNMRAP